MGEQEIQQAILQGQVIEPPCLQSLTHRQLMNNTYEPLKWIVPGLLPEGLTLLVGAPKIGKSWLSLDLCQSVAFGEASINLQAVLQGDCLYLALEDGERRLQDRFRLIQEGSQAQSDRLHLCTEIPRANDGGLEMLITWLDSHPECRLVVIDTLQKFRMQSSRGFETYASDYDALGPLQKLAQERRIALVLVHHTRKSDAKDPFDKISGSTAIMGAADCVWLLTRGRGEADGKLNITGRDVDEQDLALRFDKATCQWRVIGDAADVAASDEEHEMMDYLWEAEKPITPAQAARELGISSQAAKMRLSRMVAKGSAEKTGYGKYSPSGKSHRVTPSHIRGVTPESRIVIPFPAKSHRVTDHLESSQAPENFQVENPCDSVTLGSEPLSGEGLKSHTPNVTRCDSVTLETKDPAQAIGKTDAPETTSFDAKRFEQLNLLSGSFELE